MNFAFLSQLTQPSVQFSLEKMTNDYYDFQIVIWYKFGLQIFSPRYILGNHLLALYKPDSRQILSYIFIKFYCKEITIA